MNQYIQLEGRNYFRLKLAYALLFNKAIIISNLQRDSSDYGLTDYEMSFLNLINEITEKTKIKINETGDTLWFTPGIITNNYGKEIQFNCDKSRCLSYYCEGLIPIALYGKERLVISLTGITNNDIDNSVDSFKSSTCSLIQKLVEGDKVVFNIKKRGLFPTGNGEVYFECPIITHLNPFDWINEGKVKKVTGIAFTSKLHDSFSKRLINKSKGILIKVLPNVWIGEDNYKNKNLDEITAGYGLSLTAETTKGFFYSSDEINQKDKTPEDIGKECAVNFLKEIYNSGVVNASNQGMFLFLMALANNTSVSKMKIGKITKHTKGVLHLIYKLLKIKFHISEYDDYDIEEIEDGEENENEAEEEEEEEEQVGDEEKEGEDNEGNDEEVPKQFMFSCIGISLNNVARVQLY